MIQNKKKKKPDTKSESIFDYEARLKREALELSKNHQDTKPIKYLLKR